MSNEFKDLTDILLAKLTGDLKDLKPETLNEDPLVSAMRRALDQEAHGSIPVPKASKDFESPITGLTFPDPDEWI